MSGKTLRYSKDGLVIPSAWLKHWGKPVSVHRSNGIVILESSDREAARKRLARAVKKLRQGAQDLGPPTPDQIGVEIGEVRRHRAGRH